MNVPRSARTAFLAIVLAGLIASACTSSEPELDTGLADARSNPLGTQAPATSSVTPTTVATSGVAVETLLPFVSIPVNYQDGSSAMVDISTGDVLRFGTDPGFETGFASCFQVDPQRDAYIPIRWDIANTTPGFALAATDFFTVFRPTKAHANPYQFWMEHSGCQEANGLDPGTVDSAYLRVTLQLNEGGRWGEYAALILSGWFGPGHPNGPADISEWQPEHLARWGTMQSVEVELRW